MICVFFFCCAEHSVWAGGDGGGGGGGGGGDNFCGRRTISASGLCPWGTESAIADYVGGTKSAPTPVLYIGSIV